MKRYTKIFIAIIILETILILTKNYNFICFILSYTLGVFVSYTLDKGNDVE